MQLSFSQGGVAVSATTDRGHATSAVSQARTPERRSGSQAAARVRAIVGSHNNQTISTIERGARNEITHPVDLRRAYQPHHPSEALRGFLTHTRRFFMGCPQPLPATFGWPFFWPRHCGVLRRSVSSRFRSSWLDAALTSSRFMRWPVSSATTPLRSVVVTWA